MSSGQWRVLAILGILLGIEAATSKTVRGAVGKLARLDLAGFGASMDAAPQKALGFGLGALALVAIAAWQEGLATAIALLFLVLVLINRSDAIAPAVTAAAGAIKSATGQGTSGGSSSK